MNKTILLTTAFLFTALSLQGCAELMGESKESIAEKAAMKASIEDLRGETSRLNAEVSRLKGENSDIREKLADTAATGDELRREAASVRGLVEEKSRTAAKANENIDLLSSAVQAIDSKMAEMQKLASTGAETEKKNIDGNNEAVASLRKDLDEVKASLDALKKDIEERRKKDDEEKDRAAKAAKSAPPLPDALYAEALDLVRTGRDYDKGLDVLRRFLDLYPKNDLADNAQYWIGEIYYSKTDWERAIVEFNKVVKSYPGGDKIPAALLKQAYSFEKINSKKEARVILERLVEKYPDTTEAEAAKKRLKELK